MGEGSRFLPADRRDVEGPRGTLGYKHITLRAEPTAHGVGVILPWVPSLLLGCQVTFILSTHIPNLAQDLKPRGKHARLPISLFLTRTWPAT